jgi:hypothetical protein
MITDAVFSSATVAPTCLATKFLVAYYGYLTTLSVAEVILRQTLRFSVKGVMEEMWKEGEAALFEVPSWHLALCTEETHDGSDLG